MPILEKQGYDNAGKQLIALLKEAKDAARHPHQTSAGELQEGTQARNQTGVQESSKDYQQSDGIQKSLFDQAESIMVYHINTYIFDGLMASQIGTSEGSQTFGHGVTWQKA